MQAPGPDHLSYSRVRAFQNCGLAYFYRHVSKEPPEFTPAALAFGSAFHRAAEEALAQSMTGVEAVIDDLAKVFEESLDESEATSPIKWGERGQDQLVLYAAGLRDLIDEIGKPVRLGWWIVGKVKQPWVETVWLPEPVPSVERPVKIATIVVEAIEKQLFVPSPGIQCHGCPFRTACRRW